MGRNIFTLMAVVVFSLSEFRAHAAESFLEPGMISENQFRESMRLTEDRLPMNRFCVGQGDVRRGGAVPDASSCTPVLLDGEWRLSREGMDPIPCEVPGSIHTALMKAGVIPDPNIGTNAILGRLQSTEYDWTYERAFDWPGTAAGERDELVFEGVCDRCVVSLNGTPIGRHQGMFGGPEIDVTHFLVKGRNKLQVRLLRALPADSTVVFKNSYGWHYSQIVPLGIWRSVKIRRTYGAKLDHPFVVTRDAVAGKLSLLVPVERSIGEKRALSIVAEIAPKNFAGAAYAVTGALKGPETRLDFALPEARLWWPHGYGEQNLYWLRTRLVDADGRVLDFAESSFGVRQLSYALAPGHEKYYPIVLSVNGRKVYRKGTNWCTLDALMRFDRRSYERFLVRAKEQGVNWIRAWGLGMVETDEFYGLCDEMGILVRQEWPVGNGSHLKQPSDVLCDTVRRGVRRLRNRASLVSWCGGNEHIVKESDHPVLFGILGRETYLADGTRLYFPQEENIGRPGYAICHSHIRWGGVYPEHYLENYGSTPNSLGEWGADTLMDVESTIRTVGAEEAAKWPVDPDGPVAYHTAMFNRFNKIWHRQDGTGAAQEMIPCPPSIVDKYTGKKIPDSDMRVALAYARTFFPDEAITNLATLARGSQLVQAMALAPIIANLRSFGDAVPGFSYYKLNTCGPNGSWAVVDWFGNPTVAYWWVKAFMNPVLAAVRLPTFNFYNKGNNVWKIPVKLVDDYGRLAPTAKVRVRVIGDSLETVVGLEEGRRSFEIELDRRQIADGLRFVLSEVVDGDRILSRTWIPCNYDRTRGSLFALPKTEIDVKDDGKGVLTLRNVGKVPAVGVELSSYGHGDVLHLSDNWFWLDPGETKEVKVSFEDGGNYPIAVSAFNTCN